MGSEGKLDKRQVGLRVPLELCRKVAKGFGRSDDADASSAFLRALEEATRNVHLNLHDIDLIQAEMQRNSKKRQIKRRRIK